MEKVNQFQLDVDMMDMDGETSMNQISTKSSEKVTAQPHRKEVEGKKASPEVQTVVTKKESEEEKTREITKLPVNCGRQSRRSRSSRRSSSHMHRLWEQGCRPGSRPHLAKLDLAILIWPHLAKPNLANTTFGQT